MKKILIALLLLAVSLSSTAQLKISDLPLYTGNGDSTLTVTVVGGVNRKMYGKDLGKARMDSIISAFSGYIAKQTQNPTAILTGGVDQELMGAGDNLSYELNWTAGRLAATTTANATANLSTINIAGNVQSFSNPAAGSTVSGTQDVAIVRNTNTSISNVVTTSDGKTASATTVFNFLPKRYWFYSTSSTPSSSNVVAALGGGSELSESIAKSGFTITVSGGDKYLSYATPATSGHVTSIIINGFESILSFTETTVSVTNAAGYTQEYYVLTSNNPLPTTTINSVE